ncbi:MAG: F0F1 ATP synthase subunit alpha, partial [Halanaerobiales bacterium]
MDNKIEEITSILMQQIKQYELELEVESKGIVTYVGDGIAHVQLENVMASELLEFPGGVYGMALNLEKDSVGAVILGPYLHIKEGDEVKRTSRIMQVPVGEALIG